MPRQSHSYAIPPPHYRITRQTQINRPTLAHDFLLALKSKTQHTYARIQYAAHYRTHFTSLCILLFNASYLHIKFIDLLPAPL